MSDQRPKEHNDAYGMIGLYPLLRGTIDILCDLIASHSSGSNHRVAAKRLYDLGLGHDRLARIYQNGFPWEPGVRFGPSGVPPKSQMHAALASPQDGQEGGERHGRTREAEKYVDLAYNGDEKALKYLRQMSPVWIAHLIGELRRAEAVERLLRRKMLEPGCAVYAADPNWPTEAEIDAEVAAQAAREEG